METFTKPEGTMLAPTCPECGQEMELAHYLEGKEEFESAYICMSCPDPHFTPLD